nr:high-affinity choline transporter 1-like [Dermacentor andersoni]
MLSSSSSSSSSRRRRSEGCRSPCRPEGAAAAQAAAMLVNIAGLAVVIVFYVVVMTVGVWAGRKVHAPPSGSRRASRGSIIHFSSRADSNEDRNLYLLKLFVANRDMPLFVGITSMTATRAGAGYLLGSAAAVFSYGLVHVQAPIGYAISLLCGGRFFAQKMRNTKSLTMIDPLQQHYGRWMGLMLSLTAACADIFWTAATFTTLGQIGNIMLGLDATAFILTTAVTIFTYTGMGGLYSVAYTDVLQLAVTFLGMVCAESVQSL